MFWTLATACVVFVALVGLVFYLPLRAAGLYN